MRHNRSIPFGGRRRGPRLSGRSRGRRPPHPGGVTHSVLVRVDDVEVHCARAREHGARILMEPTDFDYGERQYEAADFAGHQWTFSQTLEDVAAESWGGILVSPGTGD